MTHADLALEALRSIAKDFASFCKARGKVTEADTRAQVIDRILEEVCGWPKAAIDRERYVRQTAEGEVSRAFIDYGLSVGDRTVVLVEAKREGVPFVLPHDLERRKLAISGALLDDGPVRDAIHQVRSYCDQEGVRYAVATNGYAWIVFRAVRDDMPWSKGHARVFPSLENIERNFTEFWNLLSYSAIQEGSLTEEFGSPLRASRELHRVSGKLFNADLPLARNRLHAQLAPIITTFFDNIGDLDQVKVLQDCYVHSASLKIVADDLDLVIRDTAPKLLQEQGAKELRQTKHGTGEWGSDFASALSSETGELFLLLGGIGSGKTTFLRRYERTVGAYLLNKFTFWFHITFLGPPSDPTQILNHICKSILDQIRDRYAAEKLERRAHLVEAFKGEVEALRETMLGGFKPGSEEYERALSPHLAKWQERIEDYVPRLLKALKGLFQRAIVLVIDNVDQLKPAFQQEVFVTAQGLTRATGAVTVVALREESYYTANTQKTFSAYSTRKFHVASPRFGRLIGNRINLALDVLSRPDSGIQLQTTIELDHQAITEFLRIVEFSIFQKNKNIARFIEALCFGNMRQALTWFSMFLTSGATDVDKMLRIYRREGHYFVAYHEFVKSVMLQERRYYSENHSPILNVFDVGSEPNSSHFTALRIVAVLLEHVSEDSGEGRGYFEVSRLASSFEDVFDNREEFVRVCERLVSKQLLEVNTRSTETIAGASHIRATSSGWYYLRYLVHSFAYLDLVLQDTPFNSAGVEASLRASVFRVDNLDREQDKDERLAERFRRVETFLTYLQSEEERERRLHGLGRIGGPVGREWVPEIRRRYEEHRDWIRRRIRDNRERYAEDFAGESSLAGGEAFPDVGEYGDEKE